MGECIPHSEIRKGMQCDDTQRADDASTGGLPRRAGAFWTRGRGNSW